MIYDLIIIGMGISGISAAIYAKRSNLNVLVVDKSMPGGLLNNIESIDNYPGFNHITGPELAERLLNQLTELKVEMKFEEVINIIDEKNIKKVITSYGEYIAKRVLIATGRSQRTLGLEHEKELLGRGISTCALCDGNFFKDKEVAVVGGGNSALQESLYLSRLVKKLYLIHRRDEFTAQSEVIDKIRNTQNINILLNSHVKELIKKDNFLGGIILNDGTKLDVNGLFIYIGFTPKADFIKDLDITNELGYILVDDKMQTKVEGIYAAGDIIKKQVYQLVSAASEGAVAAINIINSLK